MTRSLALALTLATPAAAEISPCDLGGGSVPGPVATLESAILYDSWDEIGDALPNVPEAAQKATLDWVQNLGFPLLRCDTVFVESLPPAITRRAVVFQGAERDQTVGLYMDIVEYGGQAEIVLFNLTKSLEELLRFVR